MGIDKSDLTASLNREVKFLLCCFNSCSALKPEYYTDLDLEAFLYAVESHRVTNILYLAVEDNGNFPQYIKSQIQQRYAAHKFGMLKKVAELCRVVRKLHNEGIPSIVLKGPVLGLQYYGDPTLRECNDLDILVKPHDLERAYQTLQSLGYTLSETLWSSPGQREVYLKNFHHYNMYNPELHIMVELHWKLYSSSQFNKTLKDSLWNNSLFQKLGGMEFQSLSIIDTFIYLCVHGSMHQWKRLFWILDIAKIIDKEDEELINEAYMTAIDRNVSRHVMEGCYLSHLLFKAPLSQNILLAIKKDKRIYELAALSICAINHVTLPEQSPLANWRSFSEAKGRLINYYQTTYFLGGLKAVVRSFRRFFINPRYWQIFSFSDKFFLLNYFAAPVLWIYTVINKNKE